MSEKDNGSEFSDGKPKKNKASSVFDESNTPFDEPIIKREYTHNPIGNNPQNENNARRAEPIIQEAKYEEVKEEEDDEDIPVGKKSTPEGDSREEDTKKAPSTAQMRKAAEATADALLNQYVHFFPMPFRAIAKFPEKKIEQMALSDELDLQMELEGAAGEGITVQDYIKSHNEGIDEVFQITDDMREDIREPLVEVLLENDIKLTPTQRLLMAVGGHCISLGLASHAHYNQRNAALKMFKEFHAEARKAKSRPVAEPKERSKESNDPQFEDIPSSKNAQGVVYDDPEKIDVSFNGADND